MAVAVPIIGTASLVGVRVAVFDHDVPAALLYAPYWLLSLALTSMARYGAIRLVRILDDLSQVNVERPRRQRGRR